MSRPYPFVLITEKSEKSIRGGHPWVYGEEILSLSGTVNPGDLVDVYSNKNRYLGTGFYNPKSKIAVRIFSRNTNDKFDEPFWKRRVSHALQYRKTVMGEDFHACRLIFGEADYFPGFTVDRFENILVAQILSLGIELRRDMLLNLIVQTLREMGEKIDAVYLRNDVAIRELEGLSQFTGFFAGEGLETNLSGTVHIFENGIDYTVDYFEGQKTGFFLDQKYNRREVAKIAHNKTVLDCFTHTGSFALNCAKGGAKHVTAIDISKDALVTAKENAVQNKLDGIVDFVCADVFDYLTNLLNSKESPYDFIILDPPAFTKSRSTVKDAIRGYKDINYRAMKLLPRGGYLATCSCSHFMTDTLFKQMLHNAAEDAGVTLKQIEARQQSPDHPILWNVPETEYLKFYIFQIV